MAYNKYDCDKQGSSMAGIPVKISEKYKPPKKITLPGGILNKLNTEAVLPEYDFTLERSVIDKMTQWRELRKSQREARRERVEAEKKLKASTETSPAEENSASDRPTSPSSKPYPILTPVPINASINPQSNTYSKAFNVSEFEQDTSSPFDNMELKTINDLEELAHVLQPTVISDKRDEKVMPPKLNGYTNSMYNWVGAGQVGSGWYQQPAHCTAVAPSNPPSYVVQRVGVDTVLPEHSLKSVPSILQQLELELKDKREAESRKVIDQPQQPPPDKLSRPKSVASSDTCQSSSLPNPYSELSPTSQQLTDRLAEMGFPLPRVARATQLFDEDESRVIEFLVQVQRLEEMNFPCDRAERALKANNYKETETVDYLNKLGRLLDLGFTEEQVEKALEESGLDQDKALDLLIS